MNLNNQLIGKYADLIKCFCSIYNLNVIKINTNMNGAAYIKNNDIEIPNPKTDKSLSVCLHEIGHKVLGHKRNSKKRFIEEYESWNYALNIFRILEIPIKKGLRNKYKRSLRYAVNKAKRRHYKGKIPIEIRRATK